MACLRNIREAGLTKKEQAREDLRSEREDGFIRTPAFSLSEMENKGWLEE